MTLNGTQSYKIIKNKCLLKKQSLNYKNSLKRYMVTYAKVKLLKGICLTKEFTLLNDIIKIYDLLFLTNFKFLFNKVLLLDLLLCTFYYTDYI